MIVDAIENFEKYTSLHPLFVHVLEFLESCDLHALETGTMRELRGRDLFVKIAQTKPKKKEDAKLEGHERYIDIQIPLSDTEIMGYASVKHCVPLDSYDAEKDVTFFEGLADSYIAVTPGMFAIFFPQDGHAPEISTKGVKKAVIKVRI